MDTIKNKIKKNIVKPENDSYSFISLPGIVLKANETACTCDIQFNNKKGVTETRSNVPVLNYNKSIIDWFPKENDSIMLQIKDDNITIIAPGDSGSSIRARMKLQDDMLTDTFLDNIGGYIF